MAVVIETTLGDLTVDLFIEQRPRTCLNFLKLCKMKYYNLNLFHTIQNGFIAQTGDPTGEGSGGGSIWGVLEGADKRYFSGEKLPKIRHTDPGLLSMVAVDDSMIGSQFFFTLGENLNSLDSKHCVIGEVVEGHEVLRKLNETICDESYRPYQDVRITHTVVLDDPFNDPKGFRVPSRSPSPSAERLVGGRLAPDEEIDETKGKTAEEISEMIQEKEAKARATILEIVGDLPDADMAPPENVLFVCKLNPVTSDEDLEIIFSRFGKIMNCEVIRDKKSGDSLQYAFIEFEDQKSCENAYFKMDNVLIDDRRIHVDFSQSVSKIKWQGKGRGVIHVDDSRHPGRKQNLKERNHGGRETEIRTHNKQLDVKSSSNRYRKSTRSRSRDRAVDRSRQEKSRHHYNDQPRSEDRYKNKSIDKHSQSYRDKDRNDYRNSSSYRPRNAENIDDKERQSIKNHYKNMKEYRETEEKRTLTGAKRQSLSPHNEKESKDNGHRSTQSTRLDKKSTTIRNGEKCSRDISQGRNRSASRCDTPPLVKTKKSVKRKLEDNSHKPEISQKKIKEEKKTKKKSSMSKRKKKPSTSSESSSTDSSQSSTSSSSDSSSSESDRKKKKTSKKKQIKKKKKQQTSSSSSDSSSDSSSSSSDSSSSNSSESDSEPTKKKKRNVKKKSNSKKVRSRKRKS